MVYVPGGYCYPPLQFNNVSPMPGMCMWGGGAGWTVVMSLSHCCRTAATPLRRPPLMGVQDFVHGGSPYGPSTIAGGDGSRKPLPEELAHCKAYATKFAGIVKAHVAGTAALAAVAK